MKEFFHNVKLKNNYVVFSRNLIILSIFFFVSTNFLCNVKALFIIISTHIHKVYTQKYLTIKKTNNSITRYYKKALY